MNPAHGVPIIHIVDADEGRGRPSLRASDADRDGVLGLLNHALSTGQLTVEEHGDRVHGALQARTVDDLHRITADLVPGRGTPAPSHVAPPGWYADPGQPGLQRYFDGTAWTAHLAPLPAVAYAPAGWGRPPWKGAQLGRPAQGPGALADPARRLGARLLDWLVLLPVVAALVALAVVLVAPHAGPMFPTAPDGRVPTRTPGFVWVELAVLGALVASGAVMIAYETVATARYGRTLGKAWLHIRPLRTDGAAPGWGRSFGRAALQGVAGIFSWIGLLDPLWCLWDDSRQCLHDKVAGTIVVNDPLPRSPDAPSATASADPADLGAVAATPATPAQPWTAQPGAPAWAPYPVAPSPSPAAYWGGPAVVGRTNGLAVASLVCSLCAIFLLGLPAIVGVVLGFVSRSQLRGARRFERGDGMALAGIIVGFCVLAFWTLVLTIPALAGTRSG